MAIDRAHRNQEPDIEEILDDLALRIERLRVLYEQYFMGIEKMEPHTARKEVARKVLELQQQNIRNTGLRYRFNTMVQKFSVYTTYWNRTLRAIENGTYIRDVARVGRNAAKTGQDIPDEVLRAMPERLRAKVLKDRENLVARRAKQDAQTEARADAANAKDAAAAAAATDEPSAADELALADNTEPNARVVPRRGQAIDLGDEDADIDSALDSIFGDAEEAVAKVVSRPPRPTSPPPPERPAPAPAPAPVAAKPAAPAAPPAAARPAAPPVAPPRASTPPPLPNGAAGARTPPPARTSTPPPIPPGATARVSTPPPIPAGAVVRTPTPARTPTVADERRTPTPILKTPMPTPNASAATLPAGVDEAAARDLHKKYVQAKRLLGENVDHIKYEHIVATLAKQAPAIMKQHQARSVEFQVVIKDDKVILKATPKK
jgi:hypothetical protein